jgi:predicted MFS family arabinose efflux permease
MKPTFWIQAALLVLAAAAALALVRPRRRPPPNGRAAGAPTPGAFLRDRAVWSFFVFIFLPVTACGLFLGFLFPLFAEEQGCSINEIGLAFMLFGAASVYLGPALTRLTTALFGARRAMPVGALTMTAALLLFAAFQSLGAAYATIILFGLTESLVFNQGMSYYSSLPSVRRFGADKAMGVYNVFESGGEALGPMVFGLAASLSLGLGIAAIAAALGAGAALFWALGPRNGGDRP